jgi:hypothetical protein
MKYIAIFASVLTLVFSSCGKYEKEDEQQHKGVDTTNTADKAPEAESNGTK